MSIWLLLLAGCGFISDADQAYRMDADQDGFPSVQFGGNDCDDTNPFVNPDTLWFLDNDGDGFGDAGEAVAVCQAPEGYVPDATDCDDGNPNVYPAAEELCDGVGNDCRNGVDGGLPAVPELELDRDTDGFTTCGGDCNDDLDDVFPDAPDLCDGRNNDCSDRRWPEVDASEADDDGDGVRVCGGDCDDSSASIYPGAVERCDGKRNDCNGTGVPSDELDVDSDGVAPCAGDCDDADVTTYPAAPQLCDGVNNDCSDSGWPTVPADEIDDDGDSVAECAGDCDDTDADAEPGATWHPDTDADGFGDAGTTLTQCARPANHVRDDTDCDDTDGDEYPGQMWFEDLDGDTFGTDTVSVTQCVRPANHVVTAGDCDDDDPAVYPGAAGVVTLTSGTLQAAIDGLSDGDLLCIPAGTYTENLDFNGRSVALRGPGGPAVTVVDGNFTGPVARAVAGETVTLEGLTLTHGFNTNSGGGLEIDGNADVTLIDVHVIDNGTDLDSGGGGISVLTGSASLQDVVVADNQSGFVGGGGVLALASLVDLSNVVLSNNTSGGNGGGLASTGGSLSLVDVSVTDNDGIGGGGLYFSSATDLVLSRVDMRGNTAASEGGGLFAINITNLTAANVVAAGNTAANIGGGFYIATPGSWSQLTAYGNHSDVEGGGIYLWIDGISLDNVVVADNTGGGLFSDHTTEPTLTNLWLSGNTPANYAGDPLTVTPGDSGDPQFVDVTGTDPAAWNLWLAPASGLWDAGNATVEDPDCSTSDIGAYGGPEADFSYYEANSGTYSLGTCP